MPSYRRAPSKAIGVKARKGPKGGGKRKATLPKRRRTPVPMPLPMR